MAVMDLVPRVAQIRLIFRTPGLVFALKHGGRDVDTSPGVGVKSIIISNGYQDGERPILVCDWVE